jgi:hypothetical protein
MLVEVMFYLRSGLNGRNRAGIGGFVLRSFLQIQGLRGPHVSVVVDLVDLRRLVPVRGSDGGVLCIVDFRSLGGCGVGSADIGSWLSYRVGAIVLRRRHAGLARRGGLKYAFSSTAGRSLSGIAVGGIGLTRLGCF